MTLKYKNIIWTLALLSLVAVLVMAPLAAAQDKDPRDLPPTTDTGGGSTQDSGGLPTTDTGGGPTRDSGGAPTTDRGGEGFPIETEQDVIDALNRLIDWMFTILLLVAVIMIIYAGYLFFTAAEKPDNATKARHQLLYAAIAIGVGLIARGVEALVRQLFGR